MNWIHFFAAVFVAGLAISFSDWVFMGMLFHNKYFAHPEIWRSTAGTGESKSVLSSILLGFFTAAVFAAVCSQLGFYTYMTTLRLALAIWLVAALPLILTYAVWIKFHPAVIASHSVGWLVRLSLAACAVSLILK
jgi:hypothetical protein